MLWLLRYGGISAAGRGCKSLGKCPGTLSCPVTLSGPLLLSSPGASISCCEVHISHVAKSIDLATQIAYRITFERTLLTCTAWMGRVEGASTFGNEAGMSIGMAWRT